MTHGPSPSYCRSEVHTKKEGGMEREPQPTAAPVDVAPARGGLMRRRSSPGRKPEPAGRVRRVFLWLYVLTATVVAAGVLLQAFSIAAYVRAAGQGALDLHTEGG